MRDFFLITMFGISVGLQAQSIHPDTVQQWFDEGKYTAITKAVDSLPEDSVAASVCYFNGLAHFVGKEDTAALRWLRLAIEKDPFMAGPYYYAGLIKKMYEGWEAALKYFKAAVRLNDKNTTYLTALGEAFLQLGHPDTALPLLQKALAFDPPPTKAFLLLGSLYHRQQAEEEALEVYYDCLYEAVPTDEGYATCLYNVGYYELKANRPEEAALALTTLLENYNPSDYEAMALLAQAMVRQKEVRALNYWTGKLYDAHAKGDLPPSMEERFLLDVFQWDSLDVLVYEYFSTPDTGYVKFSFVATDRENTIYKKVVAAVHPTVDKGESYFLIAFDDAQAIWYPSKLMPVNRLNYYQLREWVWQVLNGDIAGGQTRPLDGWLKEY